METPSVKAVSGARGKATWDGGIEVASLRKAVWYCPHPSPEGTLSSLRPGGV